MQLYNILPFRGGQQLELPQKCSNIMAALSEVNDLNSSSTTAMNTSLETCDELLFYALIKRKNQQRKPSSNHVPAVSVCVCAFPLNAALMMHHCLTVSEQS